MSDADVVIAGAGPAGTLAACLIARAGARVTLIDRGRFPRPKLCGDTLNPGAVALLARHVDLAPLRARATPIAGMLLSGPGPVVVRGRYDAGVSGLGVTRDVLDAWLVEEAIRAGATLIDETAVTGPDMAADDRVAGVRVRHRRGIHSVVRARMTVGAEGRRSRLGEACGLSRCAARPRRWAIGAYFDRVAEVSTLGEMHVRAGHYLGVAPTADGRVNACLVQDHTPGTTAWGPPDALLLSRLRADPVLGPRFARAVAASRASVLGPLAIETSTPGCAGLLLIGDAAGFVDPMTGDGIRLALASAEVAAAAIAKVLNGRVAAAVAYRQYAAALAAATGRKRAFNRAMRGLVGSPRQVAVAARVAAIWPGALRAAIRYAGDVPGRR